MDNNSFSNDWVHIDPISKEIYNPVGIDLCEDTRILPEVKALYSQNKTECNRFINYYSLPVFIPDDRRFYVYAWHTRTEPKRYFYVGKGTRDRYKHILDEIKDFKSGKKKHNSRYKWFAFLQEKFGIDCEILLSGLSDYEAIVYEQAIKVDFLNKGEVLLNVEGIPLERRPDGWQDRHVDKPKIENSLLYRRYLEYEDCPEFDVVDIDFLDKIYIYPYGNGREGAADKEQALLEQWATNTARKIYTSGNAKGVTAIIVLRYLSEERYRAYKSAGKKVYSSTDVIDYLRLNRD